MPGIGNSHSHAFQRAMAGTSERAVAGNDDFWSWRKAMYKIADGITPEQLYLVAAQTFMDMLKAGYTSVGEFHYLHHQPDGNPYDNPCEMAEAIIAAAKLTGIGLTLLPALYLTGGFDERRPDKTQRRFTHTLDTYLAVRIFFLADALERLEDLHPRDRGEVLEDVVGLLDVLAAVLSEEPLVPE